VPIEQQRHHLSIAAGMLDRRENAAQTAVAKEFQVQALIAAGLLQNVSEFLTVAAAAIGKAVHKAAAFDGSVKGGARRVLGTSKSCGIEAGSRRVQNITQWAWVRKRRLVPENPKQDTVSTNGPAGSEEFIGRLIRRLFRTRAHREIRR
jgi:hypothetical protein